MNGGIFSSGIATRMFSRHHRRQRGKSIKLSRQCCEAVRQPLRATGLLRASGPATNGRERLKSFKLISVSCSLMSGSWQMSSPLDY